MSLPSIIGYVAKPIIGKSKNAARAAVVATLSVAKRLAGFVSEGTADDIGKVKNQWIAQGQANVDAAQARAAEKLARATDAANAVISAKKREEMADAEIRLKNAQAKKMESQASKIDADAAATRLDAQTRQIEALSKAGDNLREIILKLNQDGGRFLVDGENLETAIRQMLPAPEPEISEDVRAMLKLSIRELKLSTTAEDILKGAGIETIGDLVECSEAELLQMKNFGKTSMKGVKAKLEAIGLSFGMDVD